MEENKKLNINDINTKTNSLQNNQKKDILKNIQNLNTEKLELDYLLNEEEDDEVFAVYNNYNKEQEEEDEHEHEHHISYYFDKDENCISVYDWADGKAGYIGPYSESYKEIDCSPDYDYDIIEEDDYSIDFFTEYNDYLEPKNDITYSSYDEDWDALCFEECFKSNTDTDTTTTETETEKKNN